MNLILSNITSIVFLGAGAFFLMHNHPGAGGFCLFVAFLTVHTVGKEDENGSS
jgi:hypothetical protein